MNNEFENIIKALKNIKLTEDEKFLMRQNVLNSKIVSPYHGGARRFYLAFNKFAPTFVLLLFVFSAGGISAFAERAVPGDLLYGLKVSINEPIAGIFAFSKVDQTKWQKTLVERRLDEAQKLVASDSLDKTTRIYLENKIKNQVDEFNKGANELALEKNKSQDSADLNIELQASFKAYQNVLSTLSDENNSNTSKNTKKETGELLSVLAESQTEVKTNNDNNLGLNQGAVSTSASTSNTTPATPADPTLALEKQAAAQDLLDSTKVLFEKGRENLEENVQNQINDKFREAETVLEQGKEFVRSSDYEKAIDDFQYVISSINEIRLTILSSVIKGNIEENIDSNPQS